MRASEYPGIRTAAAITAALLRWIPRVVAVLFVCFVGMFALDEFNEMRPLSHVLRAFAMHLVPSAILVVILALCWRWPAAGALYIVLAGWHIAHTAGRLPISAVLIIAGPALLCGTLFIVQSITQEELELHT